MSGFGGSRGGGRGAYGPSGEEQMMQGVMFKVMMGITKGCFNECVSSFKDDKLSANEQNCIKHCSLRQSDAMQSMQEIQNTLASKTGGMGGF